MSMSPGLRKQLTLEIVNAIAALSGVEWEPLADRLVEWHAGVPLRHRGQSITGNPQGYTLDSYSDDGTVAAEYGTEANYFRTLAKPKRDFAHVRDLLPSAETIYLLSNRPATAQREIQIINWEIEVATTEGIALHVFTARDVAEYIVDVVLASDTASENIADYLEPVRQLRERYAASHALPTRPQGSVERPGVERDIKAALTTHRVALVSGLSGIGKSESVVTVARALGDRYDSTLWASGLSIHGAEDLRAADVTRRGLRENILGMLSTRSCLVILDDLSTGAPLDQVLDALQTHCNPSAGVIVTSQLSVARPFTIDVPFLDDQQARKLLGNDAPMCPDDEFGRIWRAVGGHPMALRLLNGSVREGATWAEAAADAQRVDSLTVLEKAANLVDLIFARWRGVVSRPLAFFRWCDSARVHADLFTHVMGSSALRTLRRLGLVTAGEPDTIRLHDIVWSSLTTFEAPAAVDEALFAQRLDEYVAVLAGEDARTLRLNHLARVHQALLLRLVNGGAPGRGHLYAWLHHRGPGPIAVEMLPSALDYATDVERNSPDEFSAQVAAELAEAVVFLSPNTSQADAHSEHAALLRPFDVLADSPRLSTPARRRVRHHRAKALKRLRRHDDAVRELENIIAEAGEDEAPPATRLLLARTLTELPRGTTIEHPGPRAKAILLGLLTEAQCHPTQISTTVTLAAAELLRRNTVAADLGAVIRSHGAFLESLIVAAAQRGLEQGPLAFAALATAWRATDPDGFSRIYRSIPTPSAAALRETNELEAWGEILEAAAHESATKTALLEGALEFLARSSSVYAQTHAADVLTKLGRAPDAITTLEAILARDGLRESQKAWPLFRLSEAWEAAGDAGNARDFAADARAALPADNNHTPRFLEQEARLAAELGDVESAARAMRQLRHWLAGRGREGEWDAIAARQRPVVMSASTEGGKPDEAPAELRDAPATQPSNRRDVGQTDVPERL
jgi:hypothetical protein